MSGIVAMACLAFLACEREVTPLAEPICQLNQFRLCPADCGRAVEQCIEPGPHWGPCSCTVLDASYSVDAAGPDVADVLDAADTGDGDARDGGDADDR